MAKKKSAKAAPKVARPKAKAAPEVTEETPAECAHVYEVNVSGPANLDAFTTSNPTPLTKEEVEQRCYTHHGIRTVGPANTMSVTCSKGRFKK
jgi:hypothetical protein